MLTIRNPPPDLFSYVYSKHQKIKTFGFERKSYFSLKGLMIYESPTIMSYCIFEFEI
jgi:hypothetical protein